MTPMTEEQRTDLIRNVTLTAGNGILYCEDAREIIDVCLRAAKREKAGINEDMMKAMIEGTPGDEQKGGPR